MESLHTYGLNNCLSDIHLSHSKHHSGIVGDVRHRETQFPDVWWFWLVGTRSTSTCKFASLIYYYPNLLIIRINTIWPFELFIACTGGLLVVNSSFRIVTTSLHSGFNGWRTYEHRMSAAVLFVKDLATLLHVPCPPSGCAVCVCAPLRFAPSINNDLFK